MSIQILKGLWILPAQFYIIDYCMLLEVDFFHKNADMLMTTGNDKVYLQEPFSIFKYRYSGIGILRFKVCVEVKC